MRNALTDRMGEQLNTAYKKSGGDPFFFLSHLEETRDIFDVTELNDYISFHVVKDGTVYQFMWNAVRDTWSCKA